MLSIGDKVLYYPHKCYALQRNPLDGQYQWTIGIRKARPAGPLPRLHKDASPASQQDRGEVQELTHKELCKILEVARRRPAVKEKLVLIRPSVAWEGTVTAVHEDGTVDLDVQSPNPGVTLHETCVKVIVMNSAKEMERVNTRVYDGHTCSPYVSKAVEAPTRKLTINK